MIHVVKHGRFRCNVNFFDFLRAPVKSWRGRGFIKGLYWKMSIFKKKSMFRVQVETSQVLWGFLVAGNRLRALFFMSGWVLGPETLNFFDFFVTKTLHL